jgi:hypothetical protein
MTGNRARTVAIADDAHITSAATRPPTSTNPLITALMPHPITLTAWRPTHRTLPVTCGTIGADLAQRVEPESLPASAPATSAWWRDGAARLELFTAGTSPISKSTCSSQCSSQAPFYGTENGHLAGAMRSPSGFPSTSAIQVAHSSSCTGSKHWDLHSLRLRVRGQCRVRHGLTRSSISTKSGRAVPTRKSQSSRMFRAHQQ